MIKSFLLRGLISLGFVAVMSQVALANEGLTQQEADTLVKEDIAGTQVLAEVCPAILGENTRLDTNIQKLINSYLGEYSDSSMTYARLQNDIEYKRVLAEARSAAKEADQEEQKSVCQDILDFE